MIISPSRKFAFVHIPKTGGTAFTLAYEAKARADDLLFGDTPKAKRRQAKFNRTAPRRLRKHAALSDAQAALPTLAWSEFTVATIVRNPWDRLVSLYAWSRAQTFDHPMIAAARTQDFAAYLADPRVEAPLRHNTPETYLAGAAHRHILRYETLADDVATLARTLDIRLPPLERVNASDRPADYRAAYDTATIARVADLCSYEVAVLGYRFSDE
nr:sulfotransferase family 2 domain-containing protein [Rubricella aquisinus]